MIFWIDGLRIGHYTAGNLEVWALYGRASEPCQDRKVAALRSRLWVLQANPNLRTPYRPFDPFQLSPGHQLGHSLRPALAVRRWSAPSASRNR